MRSIRNLSFVGLVFVALLTTSPVVRACDEICGEDSGWCSEDDVVNCLDGDCGGIFTMVCDSYCDSGFQGTDEDASDYYCNGAWYWDPTHTYLHCDDLTVTCACYSRVFCF